MWFDDFDRLARQMSAAQEVSKLFEPHRHLDSIANKCKEFSIANSTLQAAQSSINDCYLKAQPHLKYLADSYMQSSSFVSIANESQKILGLAESSVALLKSFADQMNLRSVPFAEIENFQRSIGIYNNLIESYRALSTLSELFPKSLYDFSSFELFSSTELYRAFYPEQFPEIDQEDQEAELFYDPQSGDDESGFIVILHEIRPEFPDLYIGGKAALQADNPDRIRQGLTSFRELFNHLLTSIATDQEIRAWTSESRYFYDGRPSPRARIEYICRFAESPRFSRFVRVDTRDILEFLQNCNKGTHELRSSFTEDQLLTLQTRLKFYIRYLLAIWRASQN